MFTILLNFVNKLFANFAIIKRNLMSFIVAIGPSSKTKISRRKFYLGRKLKHAM